jgi:hypothetical protein
MSSGFELRIISLISVCRLEDKILTVQEKTIQLEEKTTKMNAQAIEMFKGPFGHNDKYVS